MILKMKTLSKVVIKNKISQKRAEVWDSVLKSWIQCHKKYLSMNNFQDNAYWFNERASISILAAAAWKLYGIALEEYKSKKIKGNNESNGRVDLWLKINEYETLIEAKHRFVKVNSSNLSELQSKIEQGLKKAEDATHASLLDTNTGVAVLFLVPQIPASEVKLTKEVLKSFDSCKCDFFAYVHINNPDFVDQEKNHCYHIGAIFGRFVRKRKN